MEPLFVWIPISFLNSKLPVAGVYVENTNPTAIYHHRSARYPLPLDPQLTLTLPYKAWQGQVSSNILWIEVVQSAKSSKTNR